MTGKTKRMLLVAGAIVIVAGLSVLIFNFVDKSKEEKESGHNLLIPNPSDVGAGNVGEVMIKDEELKEERPIVSGETPAYIYTTDGTIEEVKENGIIVWGSGNNFADKTARALTIFVDEEIIIFGNGVPFGGVKGLEGLKYLKRGDYVVVDGKSNIRGKTTFFAITIRKL